MPASALLEKASELLDAQEYDQLRQSFAATRNPRFKKIQHNLSCSKVY